MEHLSELYQEMKSITDSFKETNNQTIEEARKAFFDLHKRMKEVDLTIDKFSRDDSKFLSNLTKEIAQYRKEMATFEPKYLINEEKYDAKKILELIKEFLDVKLHPDNKKSLKNARNKRSLGQLFKVKFDTMWSSESYSEKRRKNKITDHADEFATYFILSNDNFDYTLLDILEEQKDKILEDEDNGDLKTLMLGRMDDNPLFWEMFEYDAQDEYIDWSEVNEYWDIDEDIRDRCVKPYEVFTILLSEF